MDARLSPDQEALRDSVAQVVDRLGPRTVGQIGDLERGAKLDVAIAASGWRELRAAGEDGGPLASGVESTIVAEGLGRGLADASFLGPTMASELRRLAGAPPSDSVETVALDLELSSVVRAVNGESPNAVAIDIQGSSRALLLVVDSGQFHLAQIELQAEPTGLDLTRPSMILDPTAVSAVDGADRALTEEDLERWTALGLALTCADLVGTMHGAVDLACAYASQRRQYGAAIGSFQAVQHMLADSFVAMEGARSVARHAAWAVDALPAGDALVAAAVAKAYCARAGRDVGETAIQVHGGIGNTWECLAHVFLRRALLSSDILGNARVSLKRVLASHGMGDTDGFR